MKNTRTKIIEALIDYFGFIKNEDDRVFIWIPETIMTIHRDKNAIWCISVNNGTVEHSYSMLTSLFRYILTLIGDNTIEVSFNGNDKEVVI